jgi:hypothetical protein
MSTTSIVSLGAAMHNAVAGWNSLQKSYVYYHHDKGYHAVSRYALILDGTPDPGVLVIDGSDTLDLEGAKQLAKLANEKGLEVAKAAARLLQ